MTEEELTENVARAIGCTIHIPNFYTRAQIVLKAVRGEWVAPKPTNPQKMEDVPA